MSRTVLFGPGGWDKLQNAAVEEKQKDHVQVGGDHASNSQEWMTNLFEEFLLKIISSQFKRVNLTVSEGRVVWQCHWVQNNAQSTSSRSLCAVVRLWCHTTQPYSTTERMTDLQKQNKSFRGSLMCFCNCLLTTLTNTVFSHDVN